MLLVVAWLVVPTTDSAAFDHDVMIDGLLPTE